MLNIIHFILKSNISNIKLVQLKIIHSIEDIKQPKDNFTLSGYGLMMKSSDSDLKQKKKNFYLKVSGFDDEEFRFIHIKHSKKYFEDAEFIFRHIKHIKLFFKKMFEDV